MQRMLRALEEFVIEGVKTTIPFHLRALNNNEFRAGRISTNFVELLLGNKI
jgi:acetyl-CoA carboxylase biotin carboxylase subunit